MVSPLRFLDTPDLHEPTMIAAFAGWSDAGAAASAAAQYLVDRWRALPLAEIEAEEFYDFTQHRPTSHYVGDDRKIDWPANNFHFHRTPERDIIIFNGIEPHLRWKTFVNTFFEVIERFHVSLFVSLGALFVDFPHTRPMRITGTAPTPELAERAGIAVRSGRRYEGPTGITGIMSTMMAERELAMASIWANVPHYVSATPNPSASLALLRSLSSMLGTEVPLGRMIRAATAFDTQLNEATSKNSEVSDYVRTLEERIDAEADAPQRQTELPPTEAIVQDIEEFLRNRPTTDS